MPLSKGAILLPLLTRTHIVIKLGALDSHATVPFYSVSIDVTKLRNLSAPTTDTKTPKNQDLEKLRERVPPTKAVVDYSDVIK